MISEDELIRLAQAAGYSFIPPQELFINEKNDLSSDKKMMEQAEDELSNNTNIHGRFLSQSSTRTISLLETLRSWIQSYVHV